MTRPRMVLVRATINLASPGGDVALRAGERATVDERDPEVSAWVDAGYLVPVGKAPRSDDEDG